jgi:putative ubiquitin-RnfH superfamily antitoxin RatB of RatAB toxin-antitoxin module
MPRIRVEVAHSLPERQDVVVLDLPGGATAGEAARASGLVQGAPALRLGVGGIEVPQDEQLFDGDRVEILRPLAADPGEARRRRARAQQRR